MPRVQEPFDEQLEHATGELAGGELQDEIPFPVPRGVLSSAQTPRAIVGSRSHHFGQMAAGQELLHRQMHELIAVAPLVDDPLVA